MGLENEGGDAAWTVTYRKTKDGEWVAYGPTTEVTLGAVEVQKKDGSSKTETVLSLGRTFTVDGVEMVYGYMAGTPRANGPRRTRPPDPARTSAQGGFGATYERGYGWTCDECGERPEPGTRCWETGLPH